MNKLIHKFDNLSGWVGDLISSLQENSLSQYVAGVNTFSKEKSIYLNVQSGSINKFIEKDLQFDFSEFEDVVISFMSSSSKEKYNSSSDFPYKIEFAPGYEFYINTSNVFDDVTFHLPDVDLIEKIKITALHDNEDVLIISNMVAVKDELPVDIFIGLKEQLEYDVSHVFGHGLHLGKLTATANDNKVNIIGDLSFLENNAKIKIVGDTTEYHHVEDFFNGEITFTDLYDGKNLINSHIDADVYLSFEIQFGSNNTEAVFPSIIIWGFESEPFDRGANLDTVIDTYNIDGTMSVRTEGKLQLYNLLIDVEAKQNEIIQKLSTIVRKWIARDSLWVNGRKHIINSLGSPQYLDDTDLGIIPKMQFKALLELREELWPRTTKTLMTQPPNIQVKIK